MNLMLAKNFVLYICLFFCPFVCLAQSDSIFRVPSEYIVPISDLESEVIRDLTIEPLRAKILSNNFIVVGETHGARESTAIIEQITRVKKMDQFITEVDRFSMAYLSENLDSAASILKMMPGVFAMYSYREEVELLRLLFDQNVVCKGIDLIHPATSRLILYQLMQSTHLDKKSVEKLAALVELQSQDLRKGYLSAKTGKATVKMLKRLAKECPEYEQDLILHLLKHRYLPNMMQARAAFMIKQMAGMVENSDVLTRNVLFKFGGSHTLKTRNTAGYKDIGWYLDSLSQQGLTNSFFLAIVPIKGTIGFPFEINKESSSRFDLQSGFYENLFYLYHTIPQRGRSLYVDIESFMQSLDQDSMISKELKFILDNYDAILFIDEVTPSTGWR